MKIAVIGCGLWGAAATRHLAKAGCDVTLIGPDEPQDKARHRGVFGSHYDEGRITRKNALDPYWCGVSIASIARYREIEVESGVRFYTETGALMAGGPDWMARVQEGRSEHDIPCERLDHEGLEDRFGFFVFPADFTGYFEATEAGHVSPRRLVEAQVRAARKAGAKRLDSTATAVDERGDHVRIVTDQDTLPFDHVLVATGYNTDHLLGRPDTLEVYARTVAFFEVAPTEAARLRDMPTLVWDTPDDPYLLPPIRYPDGKTYIKLGGDPSDEPLRTPDEIHDWFRSGGNAEVRDHLYAEMMKLMPDLQVQSVSMAACVTSWTKDRLPNISRQSDRVSVATGGNGAGAKCSDEIGRLAARLVLDRIGEFA